MYTDDRPNITPEDKKTILDTLYGNNDEMSVKEQIDEAIYDFVGEDEIEECDGDVHEAYASYGRGEAESQVLHDLIRTELKNLGYNPHNVDIDDFCEIYDELKDTWDIQDD